MTNNTNSLARDWDDLTTAGKVIETMSVIVQGLTVLLDIVAIGIKVGVKVGLIAAKATLAVAIPIIGAVLAVIGVILSFLAFFIKTRKEPKPPPDPVVVFINDVAKPLMRSWVEAPNPILQRAVSPTSVTAGRDTRVTFEIRNNSNRDVRLRNVRMSLYGGVDEMCLFRQDDFQIRSGAFLQTDVVSLSNAGAGIINVFPPEKVRARLDRTVFEDYTLLELNLFGNPDNEDTPRGDLLLKPWEVFRSEWNGRASGRGESKVDFVEVSEDNVRAPSVTIKRV